MSVTNWKEELAKLRGSTAPPQEKKQGDQNTKSSGKKPYQKKPPGGSPPNQPRHDGGGGRGDDRYFLPSDTLDAMRSQSLLGLKRQKVDNFALLLNKCALFDDRPKQKKFILSRKEEQRRGIDGYRLTPNFHPVGVKEIAKRHEEAITTLGLLKTEKFSLTVDWRLIVGLGNESVYETSMTLHHVYGIPYIPGQAVKGMTRSWLILQHFAEDGGMIDLKGAEKRACASKWFTDIFGCPAEYTEDGKGRRGQVIFFDAFPTHLNQESIQPDIMNSHYPDYYSAKGLPPADYQSPNPVIFLTVTNTTFEFFIGIKPDRKSPNDDKGKLEVLHTAKEALQAALTQHGIGAKTAVGYGYLTSA